MTNPPPIPKRDRSDAEYAALRNLFVRSDFTRDAICNRLQIGALHDIDPGSTFDFGPKHNAADVLTSLFVEGRGVETEELDRLLGAEALPLFKALDLVTEERPDFWAATVSLYPIEDIYTASDRYNNVEAGTPFMAWDDLVYPCLFATTRRFIEALPRAECGDVLDLCSGCGVGAILSSKAERVWAADITERSREFALFNARLNDVTNLHTLTGDMFEPTEGRRFDRIIAHPPYQPVMRHDRIFNSGGIDGEELTRRIVEDAPKHLAPGARLYCLCQITDRDQPLESRVREWLGASSADCDVAFIQYKTFEIQRYTAIATLREGANEASWRAWMKQFGQLKVKDMNYGMLVVQRHERKRRGFTVRAIQGPEARPADLEQLVDWETHATQPDFTEYVMALKPKTRTSVKMRVTHNFAETGWNLKEYRLLNDAPWESELIIDQTGAHALTLFDGQSTGRQCLNQLREVAGVGVPAFATLLQRLVSAGIVAI